MAVRYEVEEEKRKGKAGREEKRREDYIKQAPTTANCRYGRVDPTSYVRDVSHSCGSP
jgi:hypothetical protein